MNAVVTCVLLSVFAVASEGNDAMLPVPHFHQQPTDPAWVVQLAQFHGHLGPWVVAGARLGEAGRRAVGAEGFFDVRVECTGPLAKPPEGCFLDGLQVATGATLGKRNLDWQPGDTIVVKVVNTSTNKAVEVRPTKKLLDMLMPKEPPTGNVPAAAKHDHDATEAAIEATSREMAKLPQEEILTVVPLQD